MMGCVVTCERIIGELIKCLFSKNPLENFPPTSGPVNIDSSVLQPFIFPVTLFGAANPLGKKKTKARLVEAFQDGGRVSSGQGIRKQT